MPPRSPARKPRRAPANRPAGFKGHVVCIGASAGGLDALERFFKTCPTDLGAAFVVIQHLSPDHKSMMGNLLGRYTAMPVIMVEDAMPIEANTVYLIPPGAIMHISAGHLHLTPKSTRGLTLPIDIFFSSLAEIYGPRAAGVILSGTGTDGTRGAEAIEAAGGFLMAQDPETAKFDGMPRSAIATGFIDAVLPAEDLPGRLEAHVRNLPVQPPPPPEAPAVEHALMSIPELTAAILHRLHRQGGIDFADYKPATVMRRIERRMQVRHTPGMHQYLDLLDHDTSEVLTLRREMLISVTSFFRDPDAFQLLYDKVISPLVAEADAGETLRAWTAGVATGEEAYTLAMLFIEAFEEHRRWLNLKIFATDADPQCVERASAGQYPESAAAELSAERLGRFFVKTKSGYDVKNELRQSIVFARHNLLSDPPFTRMDLVVCRNTLIYFRPGAQERAVRALQFAVKEGGALMLGSSESLSTATDGLKAVSVRHKIFRRIGPTAPPIASLRAGLAHPRHPAGAHAAAAPRRAAEGAALADAGVSVLLDRYAPPAMIVNAQHEAVHLYGQVGRYLKPREGSASLAIPRLLPESLVPVASALLFKASRDRTVLSSDPVDVRAADGERIAVRLSAHPIDGQEDMCLLCFHAGPPLALAEESAVDVDAETMARIGQLERELAATRESLQATIEELETSNEELQATNEELMASNEELQSSNEELQSVNEEMNTVNAEYLEKVQILNRLNADLDSLAKAAGLATVFVDSHLLVRRFSPDATRLFRLRDADVGRRLDDIQHDLDYPGLVADLERTLKADHMVEHEVKTKDGRRIHLARILPYLVPSTGERGVVATFIEVTAYHDARRLQSILDAMPEHVAVLDHAGTILLVNAAWRHFALANGDQEMARSGIGVNYLEVCRAGEGPESEIAREAAKGIRGVLEGTLPRFSLEYPCHSPDEQRWFVLNAAPVSSEPFGAVVSHVDITAWRARQRK